MNDQDLTFREQHAVGLFVTSMALLGALFIADLCTGLLTNLAASITGAL